MNRRKFLSVGGLLSASALTGGVLVQDNKTTESEPLPEFKKGEILTTEQLNALVQRINHLETRN